MTERNTELQPHEYKPAKMEGVIATIKNLSAEKIDLVHQKLAVPMQPADRQLYFLRFWRLAEGTASVQEIPMTEKELQDLGLAIALRTLAKAESEDTWVDRPDAAGAVETGANGSVPRLPRTENRLYPVIRKKKNGTYNAWMVYDGVSVQTGGHPDVSQALHDLANQIKMRDHGTAGSAVPKAAEEAAEAAANPPAAADEAPAAEPEAKEEP
jgi:hypothetical protein